MKNDKKLDILFVHPNAARKIYQALSQNFSAFEPPIWAAMLAKFVRNKGYRTELLDCEVNRLSPTQSFDKIKELNPRIVCVVVYGQQPSASTQNMVGAMALMDLLKDTDIVRMYTGPHPSALPRQTLQDDPDSFVIQGEGPKTLEEFLKIDEVDDPNFLSKVPGLWYRNKETGQIVGNAPAPLIEDLDAELDMLPMEFLQMDKYRTANWHSWTNNFQTSPFASIYTSLGCPFRCTFCMINAPFNNGDIKNNRFRNWSPSKIIEKFDQFAKLGIRNIKIADEMFVLKKNHFLDLCNLIIERKYEFNIWAYARIDTVRKEFLGPLKKAGVNWLGLGIESANQAVRQEVTKGKFQEINIRMIVENIVKEGISPTGNFIFGLPTDTHESMQKTLDLALELPIDYGNFYCAMGYPGSELHRTFSKNKPEVLPENAGIGWIGYSQHAYEAFPLPTEHLTNGEIIKFRDEAFVKFFTHEPYLNRMVEKFGPVFRTEISRMLSVKLKRKLLGDKNEESIDDYVGRISRSRSDLSLL